MCSKRRTAHLVGTLPSAAVLVLAAFGATAAPAAADDPAVVALPEVVVASDPTASVAAKMQSFETARKTIFPTINASVSSLGRDSIVDRPQGSDTPFDRLLTELPGVSQDSAASRPDFHIRNEYGNV